MKTIQVKDLMVPLKDYATVYENDHLYQAVEALEEAQANFLAAAKDRHYPHRAVLVLNSAGKVMGKLSQLDVLRSLEPKYNELFDSKAMTRTTASGFSPSFLRTMISSYKLFDRPLRDLCRKAASIQVKECMYTPESGEYVQKEDTLEVAVHQLIVGQHQSLLVLHNQDIVGIIRLVDVFYQIGILIKSCALTPSQGEKE